MDKKKIAKLFVDSFKTDIKDVILEGELKGCGGTVKQFKQYEVIFSNYATYKKREFSNDYRYFAKKLGKIYGVDWHEIKKPIDKRDIFKSFYFQWDPEQIIEVDCVKFRMGRKMMNMPHAILDGCSQTFYIDVDDQELAEEISKIHKKNVDDRKKEKEDSFPEKVENAKSECREMIDTLTKIINGDLYIADYEDISRIHDAHFQVCEMLHCVL